MEETTVPVILGEANEWVECTTTPVASKTHKARDGSFSKAVGSCSFAKPSCGELMGLVVALEASAQAQLRSGRGGAGALQ